MDWLALDKSLGSELSEGCYNCTFCLVVWEGITSLRILAVLYIHPISHRASGFPLLPSTINNSFILVRGNVIFVKYVHLLPFACGHLN